VQVQAGTYAMIAVSDTGIGIPREIMAHIFEPFFTTKEKGKGTGLGLATVYGIVKQSGGYVWAYSEPGQGTTFKVYLPVVESEAVVNVAGNKGTILVIEDDETTLTVTVQALEADGYHVLSARDGTEALAVCQQCTEKIDLVLTDVMADGMSGEDLMGYFAVKYPKMAVVHMSGFARVRLEQAHTLFPDAMFLPKPFTVTQLTDMIQQALQRRARSSPDSLPE
jgi:CheY-like chemotaxis protein